jgi:hypothetical protein
MVQGYEKRVKSGERQERDKRKKTEESWEGEELDRRFGVLGGCLSIEDQGL